MKRILILIALIAAPALAQQPQPTVEDMRMVAQAVTEQRNAAQDTVAQLSVVLRKLEAEVERLKKACGDLCKPKDEKK